VFGNRPDRRLSTVCFTAILAAVRLSDLPAMGHSLTDQLSA
jgi:hypothetical protein